MKENVEDKKNLLYRLKKIKRLSRMIQASGFDHLRDGSL
jgi:hypothetical protein